MKKQSGLSAVVLLILVVAAAFGAKVALTIGPMYYDDLMVDTVLKNMHDDQSINLRMTLRDFKENLDRRLSSNRVDVPTTDLTLTRESDGLIMDLKYEVRGPLLGNIDAVVTFSHREEFKL